MMIDFSTISDIFSGFLKDPQKQGSYEDELECLVFSSIKINKTLWDLEDSARMSELGDHHVSEAKRSIDSNNQDRNDLIRKIDIEISGRLNIIPGSPDKFYSESPGMIIDRLSIIFIKSSVIKKLLSVMEEDDLRREYEQKERVVSGQMGNIGRFLDTYLKKLMNKEAFFEIQQSVKMYNDPRIKNYMHLILHE